MGEAACVMESPLAQVRCFKHVSREAAAKCPECARFFCRECVTEHAGRVVCRSCLERLLAPDTASAPRWLAALKGWALAGFGSVIALGAFYFLGRLLLRIPTQFHSGSFFE